MPIAARRAPALCLVSIAALAFALTSALAACVPTSNAYDPDTPADAQARARVTGRVVAESLAVPAGLPVDLVQRGEPRFSTTTDDAGAFTLADVTPGTYTLEVRATGFLPLTLPVELFPGDALKVGDLFLVAQSGADASAIVGTATLEGQGGEAHGGILVEAVGRSFTTVTSSTGAFRLPVVAGTYDLRLSKPSFQTVTVPAIEVAAGEERALDAVVLSANPATLTGTVEGELEDGSVAALADATVTVEGTALTALTNGSGDFTLTGVPPGSHLVRVVKDGYVGASATAANVVGGEVRPLGDFSLRLTRGDLRGQITLADTADASGVVVELVGTDRAAVTGSSGAFSFDDVLVGTYAVSARRDGYNARNLGTFTVAADTTTDVGSHTLSRKSGLVSIVEGAATNSVDISLLITAPLATGYKASEDPTFQDPALGDVAADAFRPFVPGQPAPFTLSDEDGLRTVYVVTTDGTTTSAPASAEVVLDRQAPAVGSLVIGSGAAYLASASGLVTLHLEGFDLPPAGSPDIPVSGLARMFVSNDPALAGASPLPYTATTTHTLATPTSEGTKTVYARFEDAAGNQSEIVSAVVVLDNTPPANVSLVLEGDSDDPAYSRSPFFTAVLFADDDNGGAAGEDLLVRLSNEPGFTGASYQPFGAGMLTWLASPGDGEKTVYAQVRDPAGNESLVVSDTIVLDTAPPTGAFVLVAGGTGTTTSAAVNVTLAASGATEMALSQDGFSSGTTWEPYAPSKSYALAAQGNVTVSAKFRDDAGWETGIVTDSILFDSTPPGPGTLTLTGTLGDGATSATLTASAIVLADPLPAASDRGQPLSMALVESADGTCTASDFPASPLFVPYGRSSFALTGGDGNKTVCVIFQDAAGNFDRSTARGATIRLDTTPPSAPIFEDVASGLTSETAITATITPASDDAGAVTHRCFGGTGFGNGGAVCDPSSPIVFALRPDSENTLGVRGCDAARNCAEARVTVQQDATAPLTPVLNRVTSNESSISVSWQPSASADAAGYLLYYGTAPGDRGSADAEQGASPIFVGDTTSYQLSGLSQGTTYYVSIAAVDEAGNLGDPSGEVAAMPSKASVRFVSSLGGQPNRVGALAGRGYFAEPQGVVQVDLSASAAQDMPIGRANVPNVVPDALGVLPVLPCVADGIAGHCVIVTGSTLEGVMRADLDNFRAGATVVYFPPGGAPRAPAEGRVLTTLPSPARAVVVDPSGESAFHLVDAHGVVSYRLGRPPGTTTDVPILIGEAVHPTPLRRVLGAGVVAGDLYVLGQPRVANPACAVDGSACVELYVTSLAALSPRAEVVGEALGILMTAQGHLASYDDGYPGFAFANGLNVVTTVSNDENPAWQDLLVSHHHVDASGRLELAPSASRRVVVGTRSALRPLVPTAYGARLYLPGHTGSEGQIYTVDVGEDGSLSLGPTALPFSEASPLGAIAVSDDHVFAAEPAGLDVTEQRHMRWTNGTNLPSFGEVLIPPTGTVMAAGDGLVFLARGRKIYTFDVTNASAPVLVGGPAENPSRFGGYTRLRVQGHLVFAAAETSFGIDVFRYDSALADLVFVTSVGGAQYTDFTVVGDRVYAAREAPSSAGIDRFVLSNAFAATSLGTCASPVVPYQVDAIAVRHDTAFLATRVASGASRFRVIDVDSCTAISGDVVLPEVLAATQLHVSVSGTRAIVSGHGVAYALNVNTPSNPSLDTGIGPLALGGATAQAGGYLIGLGNRENSVFQPGPRLVNPYGEVDGFLSHAPCGQDTFGYSSLALRDGLVFASCGVLGVQIVRLAAATGGTLAQERYGFGSGYVAGDRLASDGNFAFMGVGADLYHADAQYFAADYPEVFLPEPVLNTDTGTSIRTSVSLDSGTLITVGDGTPDSYLQLRDTGDVNATWPQTVNVTLSGLDVRDTPVTNGRMLYVPVTGAAGSFVRVYGLSDRNQLNFYTQVSTPVATLALSRDRLYVVDDSGDTVTLRVYRLSDAGLPTGAPGVFQLDLGAFVPHELSVHGGQMMLTGRVDDAGYALLLFPDPGLGSGVITMDDVITVQSQLELFSPVVSGDVLYVAENEGLTTFDIARTFSAGVPPRRLSSIATGDARTNSLVDLSIAGPFVFLVGERYRVFDMR